ncbi:MAG: Gfo/Idh/MocA family oxidoreductase [bacterium]
MRRFVLMLTVVCTIAVCFSPFEGHAQKAGDEIRIGMIGLDTSHVIAFTSMLNDPSHKEYVPGAKVVVGFKGGSPDVEASWSRVDKYTAELQDKWGVKIVDSIPELCTMVDAVMIESVEGRPHLAQAIPVIEAGLPLFIDKPMTASLADAIEIARLAKKANVPWFSASSLRFASDIRKALDPELTGKILGCDAFSPCGLEPHHPDLFWYGIHGVEILYTAMGPGCVSVSRVSTPDTDIVVGQWKDGRIGTFRGTRNGQHDYGCTVFGEKATVSGKGHDYRGLVVEIVNFFKTGIPPVSPEETLELLAFMEAADTSKAKNGASVPLPSISLEE